MNKILIFYTIGNERKFGLDVFDVNEMKFKSQKIEIKDENLKFEILGFDCMSEKNDLGILYFECGFITNSIHFKVIKFKFLKGKIEKISEEKYERFADFEPEEVKINKEYLVFKASSSYSKSKKILVYKRPKPVKKQGVETPLTYLYTSIGDFENFELKNSNLILVKKREKSSALIAMYRIKPIQIYLKQSKDLEQEFLRVKNVKKIRKKIGFGKIFGIENQGKTDTKEGKSLNFTTIIFASLMFIFLFVLGFYYWLKRRRLRKLIAMSKREEEVNNDLDSSVADMVI